MPLAGLIRDNVPRMPVERVWAMCASDQAFIVCAHENTQTCETPRVKYGLTLEEFREIECDVPIDARIFFYCDSEDGQTSVRVAAKYRSEGRFNVMVVKDGIHGLRKAGCPMASDNTRKERP